MDRDCLAVVPDFDRGGSVGISPFLVKSIRSRVAYPGGVPKVKHSVQQKKCGFQNGDREVTYKGKLELTADC
jgi:hypothetical protein